MLVKFFFKTECPNCKQAKNTIDKLEEKIDTVERFDIETVDGLAEASFYEIGSIPSLLIFDKGEKPMFSYYLFIPTYEHLINKIQKICSKVVTQ